MIVSDFGGGGGNVFTLDQRCGSELSGGGGRQLAILSGYQSASATWWLGHIVRVSGITVVVKLGAVAGR